MDNDDRQFMEAIQEVDNALGASGSAQAMAAGPIEDICSVWGRIKRYMPIIIKVISKIPVYGGTIANLLRILEAALNKICP